MSKIIFPLSKDYNSSSLEPKEAQVTFDAQKAHQSVNQALGFLSGLIAQNPPPAVEEKVTAAQRMLSEVLRELEKMGAKF